MAGRLCLAYSGGLDTSCILRWLLDAGYEVICFLANVGQLEDFDAVEAKALKIGASKMVILDLRREFIEEFCFRAIQCNAQYEGRYLLGTSLARPAIARAQMRVAKEHGCDFVSHGCTGKGNDGIRFELAFLSMDPKIQIIAPWRMPKFYEQFQGRNDLLDYAAAKKIPTVQSKAKPYSMDDNLSHCSYEAGMLEDPAVTPPDDMWTRTVDPRAAPDIPVDITLTFEQGIPTRLTADKKEYTDSIELFDALNDIGNKSGIGRIDIVENRFIGLKSRGCYDAPAMTILRLAHLDAEGLVLDSRVRSLRDCFVTHNWTELIYNGLYFSPEREFLENSLLFSQQRVNAEVRLRCYKGSVSILGRSSKTEKLYSEEDASMDSLENFTPLDTSKRNTSLAFFTAHERNQLKSTWGSQATRLTRDSFLPFASCNLCLQPSRDAVACASHGDIFCRECIVSNLLAQRKEIKRLEKEDEKRKKEDDENATEKLEEEKERSVREFERTMMGLEGTGQQGKNKTSLAKGEASQSRGVKRKFELNEEEMLKNAKEERVKARKAIDDEKSAKQTLPSFWVPSLTPSTGSQTSSTAVKPSPICPASSPTVTHPLSLKSLVTIHFSTSTASSNPSADQSTLICPACNKILSNASKAMLTIPCGHVLCKPCAQKFMSPTQKPPDPHAEQDAHEEDGRARCYVCETVLTEMPEKRKKGGKGEKGREKGPEQGLPRRGLVELRSEGTGFAGGGSNMAKREGVAFQC
ncbi:MAG: hypothetical protein Q9216_005563 [Gyalolechia sp. 2 TL-2023]